MTREEKFTFRLDAEDRRRLVEIARRLERSQADALRRLIRQAYRELAIGGELETDDRRPL